MAHVREWREEGDVEPKFAREERRACAELVQAWRGVKEVNVEK
jgi:hypothetical protein